jgi:hypothetical protein
MWCKTLDFFFRLFPTRPNAIFFLDETSAYAADVEAWTHFSQSFRRFWRVCIMEPAKKEHSTAKILAYASERKGGVHTGETPKTNPLREPGEDDAITVYKSHVSSFENGLKVRIA